MDLKTCAPIGQ